VSYAIPFFFAIAILFSSVGFGGGSGYLAILSTTGMDHEKMRFIALCCNILVVALNTFVYIKKKLFSLKKVLPFVVLSIPMAAVGGYISLPTGPFFVLLGITLLLAGVLMIAQLPYWGKVVKLESVPSSGKFSHLTDSIVGGVVGFVSGLVGIGGGIFLSPFLHLNRWEKSITIAATASFFIFVNSISGLIGQISNHPIPIEFGELTGFLGAVILGSFIGRFATFKWMKTEWIRIMTAILVIFAAVRILLIQT